MLSVLTLPHAGGGAREGEQHGLRAVGRRLDGEGLADPLDGAAPARRRRVGEHVQPLRPDVAVRRLQGVRLRPRGRPARARAVPRLRRHDPRAGQEDLQALRGRRVPALGVRPHLRGGGAQHRAGVAQGPARRGPGRARRARQVGRDDRVQPRAGALPRRRDDGGAGAELAALCGGRDEVERAIDRVVWYAGWTDKLAQVLGGANPVAGPYFNFTMPEPTGVVGIVAPGRAGAARARLAARAGAGRRQHRRRGRVRGAPARGDRARRGARDLRRAGRRREHPHRPARRAGAAPGLTPRHRRARPRRGDAELERAAAENVKRVVRERGDVQSPYEISTFLELKTVWHPMGQ